MKSYFNTYKNSNAAMSDLLYIIKSYSNN